MNIDLPSAFLLERWSPELFLQRASSSIFGRVLNTSLPLANPKTRLSLFRSERLKSLICFLEPNCLFFFRQNVDTGLKNEYPLYASARVREILL